MTKKSEKKTEEKKIPEVKKPITTNTTNVKKKAKVDFPKGFVPLKRLTKEENVIISTHNIEEIQASNKLKAEKEKKK